MRRRVLVFRVNKSNDGGAMANIGTFLRLLPDFEASPDVELGSVRWKLTALYGLVFNLLRPSSKVFQPVKFMNSVIADKNLPLDASQTINSNGNQSSGSVSVAIIVHLKLYHCGVHFFRQKQRKVTKNTISSSSLLFGFEQDHVLIEALTSRIENLSGKIFNSTACSWGWLCRILCLQ